MHHSEKSSYLTTLMACRYLAWVMVPICVKESPVMSYSRIVSRSLPLLSSPPANIMIMRLYTELSSPIYIICQPPLTRSIYNNKYISGACSARFNQQSTVHGHCGEGAHTTRDHHSVRFRDGTGPAVLYRVIFDNLRQKCLCYRLVFGFLRALLTPM